MTRLARLGMLSIVCAWALSTPALGQPVTGMLTGTVATADGARLPSELELGMAGFQGKHVTEIAKKLRGV